MPVKLNSTLPDEVEARIEIIPLIDIMFFLLATFMLVSLSMVNLKSVKVNLPTATVAGSDAKPSVIDISVDKAGSIYLDRQLLTSSDLVARLVQLQKQKPDVRVLISGDRDARHGDVIRALDLVRSAGVDKVAFEIRPAAEEQR